MVKIRLARGDRKKEQFYRIVAIDGTKSVRSAYLAILGYWNKREDIKKVDKKGIADWVSKGAKVSPAVQKLI